MAKHPWCTIHSCHPKECFWKHNTRNLRHGPTPEELAHSIMLEHIAKQNENIRRESSRVNDKIIDARKKFEENHRKEA